MVEEISVEVVKVPTNSLLLTAWLASSSVVFATAQMVNM